VRAFVAVLALATVGPLVASGAAASEQFELLRLDGSYLKWGTPRLGTPAQVRYAFVTEPVRFAGAINCEAMVPLDPLLATSHVERARFREEVAAAFDMWRRAADVTFAETSDPASADILIGAQASPRGFAFTNVDYDRADPSPVGRIKKSLICLNPTKAWKVGFDGNMDVYDIRYVIGHEVGHAIGLDHPSPSGQLMSFRYGEDFRVLRSGDASGAAMLYGKPGTPVAAAPPQPAGGRAPDMALR
jgi:Matrixin